MAARWPRETFVGLQGSWGTVKIGNFLAPYDDIHPIFGNVPTLTTSILSTAALWAQGSQTKDNGGFDARLGNSIRYDSPRIAGFVGSVQIADADTSNSSLAQQQRHAYVLSTGGFYANGPFQAGIAYEAQQQGSRSVDSTTGRSRRPPTGTSASSRSVACTSASITTPRPAT